MSSIWASATGEGSMNPNQDAPTVDYGSANRVANSVSNNDSQIQNQQGLLNKANAYNEGVLKGTQPSAAELAAQNQQNQLTAANLAAASSGRGGMGGGNALKSAMAANASGAAQLGGQAAAGTAAEKSAASQGLMNSASSGGNLGYMQGQMNLQEQNLQQQQDMTPAQMELANRAQNLQATQIGNQASGQVIGAAAAGVGAAMMSDERNKTGIHAADADLAAPEDIQITRFGKEEDARANPGTELVASEPRIPENREHGEPMGLVAAHRTREGNNQIRDSRRSYPRSVMDDPEPNLPDLVTQGTRDDMPSSSWKGWGKVYAPKIYEMPGHDRLAPEPSIPHFTSEGNAEEDERVNRPMNRLFGGKIEPVSADADLSEPGGPAHWTLREEKNFLLAKNQRTGEMGKVRVDPLTPSEKKEATMPHGAGGLGANDPNRQRTVVHDADLDARMDAQLGEALYQRDKLEYEREKARRGHPATQIESGNTKSPANQGDAGFSDRDISKAGLMYNQQGGLSNFGDPGKKQAAIPPVDATTGNDTAHNFWRVSQGLPAEDYNPSQKTTGGGVGEFAGQEFYGSSDPDKLKAQEADRLRSMLKPEDKSAISGNEWDRAEGLEYAGEPGASIKPWHAPGDGSMSQASSGQTPAPPSQNRASEIIRDDPYKPEDPSKAGSAINTIGKSMMDSSKSGPGVDFNDWRQYAPGGGHIQAHDLDVTQVPDFGADMSKEPGSSSLGKTLQTMGTGISGGDSMTQGASQLGSGIASMMGGGGGGGGAAAGGDAGASMGALAAADLDMSNMDKDYLHSGQVVSSDIRGKGDIHSDAVGSKFNYLSDEKKKTAWKPDPNQESGGGGSDSIWSDDRLKLAAHRQDAHDMGYEAGVRAATAPTAMQVQRDMPPVIGNDGQKFVLSPRGYLPAKAEEMPPEGSYARGVADATRPQAIETQKDMSPVMYSGGKQYVLSPNGYVESEHKNPNQQASYVTSDERKKEHVQSQNVDPNNWESQDMASGFGDRYGHSKGHYSGGMPDQRMAQLPSDASMARTGPNQLGAPARHTGGVGAGHSASAPAPHELSKHPEMGGNDEGTDQVLMSDYQKKTKTRPADTTNTGDVGGPERASVNKNEDNAGKKNGDTQHKVPKNNDKDENTNARINASYKEDSYGAKNPNNAWGGAWYEKYFKHDANVPEGHAGFQGRVGGGNRIHPNGSGIQAADMDMSNYGPPDPSGSGMHVADMDMYGRRMPMQPQHVQAENAVGQPIPYQQPRTNEMPMHGLSMAHHGNESPAMRYLRNKHTMGR